jgi:hypothetical protein
VIEHEHIVQRLAEEKERAVKDKLAEVIGDLHDIGEEMPYQAQLNLMSVIMDLQEIVANLSS